MSNEKQNTLKIDYPFGKTEIALPHEVGELSDGFHTFNELYEHRHALFLALCSRLKGRAWWSELHADGSSFVGWVVVGLELPSGPITYHLPERLKPAIELAGIEHRERAEEWDGHTSDDVINRLAEALGDWANNADDSEELDPANHWCDWLTLLRRYAAKMDFPLNEVENFTAYRSFWLEGISPEEVLNGEASYSEG